VYLSESSKKVQYNLCGHNQKRLRLHSRAAPLHSTPHVQIHTTHAFLNRVLCQQNEQREPSPPPSAAAPTVTEQHTIATVAPSQKPCIGPSIYQDHRWMTAPTNNHQNYPYFQYQQALLSQTSILRPIRSQLLPNSKESLWTLLKCHNTSFSSQ